MKKTTLIFVLFTALSACTKDLTSLNNDPKNPLVVTSASLFTDAQRQLSKVLASSSVNVNIFRLIEQQWQETTYVDESNYDITTRQIPDEFWRDFYALSLQNFERAKQVIPTDVTVVAQQKGDLAVTDIMEVYAYYYLVTTFGNVPYTDALNVNNVFPKFDDQKTVYYDLLTRLDADIEALKAPDAAISFGGADILYTGDVGAWLRFANTFKLKMGITIADYDKAKAQAVVSAAVTAGVFTSNGDNATFKYVASPPNTNPIWVDLVQSGRQDFVANGTFINFLNPEIKVPGKKDPERIQPDPRLPYYFTTNADGEYAGGDNGESASPFSAYSKPSGPLLVASSIGKITNPDFPGLLLDYSETEFNLAEASLRGFIGTPLDASVHYKKAIQASMEYWGVTSDVNTYLTYPRVIYPAGGTKLVQLHAIALQKYLALYNRGVDAWIETRRLDYPALVAPPEAKSAFPVRFTYPINEQNVNKNNYDQASAAIGGDAVTTKLFFDVTPKP